MSELLSLGKVALLVVIVLLLVVAVLKVALIMIGLLVPALFVAGAIYLFYRWGRRHVVIIRRSRW